MFSYLGGKDASSCTIQLSTEDPDSQKEQTTNLPSLQVCTTLLRVLLFHHLSHALMSWQLISHKVKHQKKAVGFVSKLDIDRWPT